MNWFGESWGAPVCEPQRKVPTPVGRACIECDKPIEDGDTGFVLWATEPIHYHRVCFLRTIIPCEMWSAEMLSDMPERWRQHRQEDHPPYYAPFVPADPAVCTCVDPFSNCPTHG